MRRPRRMLLVVPAVMLVFALPACTQARQPRATAGGSAEDMRAVEGLNVVITGPREFRSGSQASIGITASNPSTSTLSMDPVRIIEIRNERRSVEGTVSFLMPTKLSPGTSYSGSTEVTVPSPGSYTVGLPGRSETYLSFESK